ncbi:bacteriocin propeptide, TIGR03798 family [Desulfovibrio sp. X2]|uniref:Nif11-like leader peptide family natural product precursor n=1 Tax=Desulfovibrio sp. X2 TaxID=941449 RepID=UPI000358CD28|nr:Nif11-like leader peptide family natural product precursor [Desulfovibrio sp. X2]EPR42370.1 bacteriocin propeptide, TIGR03798 family [Desulfovibrio sp. X2]
MPMAHVRPFLKQALTDKELRDRLLAASNGAERVEILAAEGYEFTDEEFEEGYRGVLTSLQFERDADQLKEFKLMWDMLRRVSP